MSANLLHVSKLEAFKSWLTKNERGWRDGKGPYQVIQVLTENSGWQVVFRRDTMPEHFSINTALEPLVRRFIRESKLEEEVAAKAIDWHEQEIQVCEMLDAAKLKANLQLAGLPVLTDVPWEGEQRFEKERCPFCGAMVECPCDEPPPDTCEKALNAAYGDRPGGMR